MNWRSADSLDGRYFGVLPSSAIIGKAEPLWIGGRPMTVPALRSLTAMLCFVTIVASSMMLSNAAYAGQASQPPHRASSEPLHPFAAFVTEASRRFSVPEHWIRAVMHVESGAKPRVALVERRHGIDANHAEEPGTTCAFVTDSVPIPTTPTTTSWLVPLTSASSTIVTARRAFLPPTMRDLDATNAIWRPVDRCRMRRGPMSRRSHR